VSSVLLEKVGITRSIVGGLYIHDVCGYITIVRPPYNCGISCIGNSIIIDKRFGRPCHLWRKLILPESAIIDALHVYMAERGAIRTMIYLLIRWQHLRCSIEW